MQAQRERGVALITAILVVALATILLALILDQSSVMLARTQNIHRSAQADALAKGIEDWAIQILQRDLSVESTSGSADHLGDIWAQPLPVMPISGGQVTGRMRDLNGCFNLNALRAVDGTSNQIWLHRFERLLEGLQLDSRIASAAADWVDSDQMPETSHGAEDQAYVALIPPYRVANRAFVHISELRKVRGVTAQVWKQLQPHVCVAPMQGWTLNVNTASIPVLMALDVKMTNPIARRLHQDGHAHYASIDQFNNELVQFGLTPVNPQEIDVRSRYFQAQAEIELDRVPIRYTSVIQRLDAAHVRVIARARGVW
jgi:general secretion pathway protein K